MYKCAVMSSNHFQRYTFLPVFPIVTVSKYFLYEEYHNITYNIAQTLIDTGSIFSKFKVANKTSKAVCVRGYTLKRCDIKGRHTSHNHNVAFKIFDVN
jgi:hypothetical protein